MKKLIALIVIGCLLVGCAKTPVNSPINVNFTPLGTYSYTVQCSKGGWTGTYTNSAETGVYIQVLNSQWTFNGYISATPQIMEIVLYPEPYDTGVTFNIKLYCNDTLRQIDSFTTSYNNMQGIVQYTTQ